MQRHRAGGRANEGKVILWEKIGREENKKCLRGNRSQIWNDENMASLQSVTKTLVDSGSEIVLDCIPCLLYNSSSTHAHEQTCTDIDAHVQTQVRRSFSLRLA